MLNSDLPISTANEDRLNRRFFAENLAKVMLEYSSPEAFAIGLYGEWGSGKTSVINLTIEQIERASKDIVILKFNPWLCADPQQLISQFFLQLSSEIKLKKSKLLSVCDIIDQYAEVFELINVIPVAGFALSSIFKIVSKKAKSFKEKKTGNIQNIKNTLVSKLALNKIKIIVTIDDIDRLSESEIISVFQLVKSLADFPYTIYLLAFDYNVVVNALTKVQNGSGIEYLEKIIQVPFALPMPNKDDIYEILFKKLDNIVVDLPENKWDKDAWNLLIHFGLKGYINSIRDIIRYTNVFSLKYSLLKSETDTVDLLGLTCIQVFEPVAYSKLTFYKDNICGGGSSYADNSQEESEELKMVYRDIVESVAKPNLENFTSIITCLFPKLYLVTKSYVGTAQQYHHKSYLIKGKIACPECFARYFALTLEVQDISLVTLNDLLLHADEGRLIQEIKKMNSNNNALRFLDHVEAYSKVNADDSLTADRAWIVSKCLVKLWNTFNNEDQSLFATPSVWRLNFCVEALLSLIEQQDRVSLLISLFSDLEVSVSTIAILLRDFQFQHNRFVEKEKYYKNPLLKIEGVYGPEAIFVKRALAAISDETFFQDDKARNVLWMVEQLDPSFSQDIIPHLITDNTNLAYLIHRCVSHGTAITITPYKTWHVEKEHIIKYIKLEEAYVRIHLFVQQKMFWALPKDVQESIAAFLLAEVMPDANSFHNDITATVIDKELKRLSDLVGELDSK